MNFFGSFIVSKLPLAFEEVRMVEGKEQVCIVLPTESCLMKRSRRGTWSVPVRLDELPPNPRTATHRFKLDAARFRSWDKLRSLGVAPDDVWLGEIRPFIDAPEKALDYTNNMTDIVCEGVIFIDDIKMSDVLQDPRTGRRFVNVKFRRSEKLDREGNSHELVIGPQERSVARLRQTSLDGKEVDSTPRPFDETQRNQQPPTSYNGLRF